jgi:Tol biopolymer transport system component
VVNVDPNGGDAVRVAGGGKRTRPLPIPFDSPSWSGDGSTIAFTGVGGKVSGTQGFETPGTQIFLVGADGAGLRAVPGTEDALGPVLSPDGRTIAFARVSERRRKNGHGEEKVVYRSVSAWLAHIDGSPSTQLTPWRNGLEVEPASFSPDGSTLSVGRISTRHSPPEVMTMPLDGSPPTVIAHHATDPVYSPDGRSIAFIRPRLHVTHVKTRRGHAVRTETAASLFTMNADGSGVRRLAHARAGIDIWPSWDPSGRRLAYTHFDPDFGEAFGRGDQIVEINADGSCAKTVLRDRRAAYFGAAWQPGPGREAGPISC